MIRFFPALVIVLAALFVGGAAQAHPHVWVTMKSTVVYSPDGTAIGVRQAWTFDDMYSAFAVQGLDQKEKNKFTRAELQSLAQVNVESLKEYEYFTFAKANGKTARFKEPVDYYLEYNDAILTLHFLLPFRTPVKAQTLNLEVYDPTYFVDFALEEKDPVALSGAPAGCALSLGKPQGMTKELAQTLAEIPADGKIPDNTYGAAFANKINVKCP